MVAGLDCPRETVFGFKRTISPAFLRERKNAELEGLSPLAFTSNPTLSHQHHAQPHALARFLQNANSFRRVRVFVGKSETSLHHGGEVSPGTCEIHILHAHVDKINHNCAAHGRNSSQCLLKEA